MPTDGTLLLEHMPNGKQYLVTALSVFFSFGAVLSAVVGLLVIPGHSCPPAPATCDVGSENMGWKYLLIVLGIIVRPFSCLSVSDTHLTAFFVLTTFLCDPFFFSFFLSFTAAFHHAPCMLLLTNARPCRCF